MSFTKTLPLPLICLGKVHFFGNSVFFIIPESLCNITQDKVGELICEITRRGINIAPDYETYRNVGFSLANEFGEGGRSMFHAICSTSEKYKQADADRQFSACLKTNTTASKITIASFFYLCQQAGLENF